MTLKGRQHPESRSHPRRFALNTHAKFARREDNVLSEAIQLFPERPISIPVLPSEVLAPPEQSRTDIPGTVRQQARQATVSRPLILPVKAGDTDVLLTRLPDGEAVAFAPNCPHQGTPLNDASIFEGKLRCPKHQYLYDPHTGENIFPSREAVPEGLWKLKPGYLRTYPVEERDGWVWVCTTPNPPPAGYNPAAELPPGHASRISRGSAPQRPSATPDETRPREHPPECLEINFPGEIELELPTAFVPGYVWLFETGGECVQIVGQVFDEDRSVHRLKIGAAATGETTLRCTYSKPWGKDCREVRTFRIRIV